MHQFLDKDFSHLAEMSEAILVVLLDRLIVTIVDQTRLDTGFDHLEVGLLQRLWNVRFCFDLLELLVHDTRWEPTSVKKRLTKLGLEQLRLGKSFFSSLLLVALVVELLFLCDHDVV